MAGAVMHGGRRLVVTELQVIAAIARGRTNQEVAADLEIMPTTIKTYLRNTMRKLGAHRVETVHVENSTACRALCGH
jgi:LuxR family transcriptional regulator, regulator of acetate metabolism